MPRGRPPKPKPLPQKVEREMMGDEDIQSTERELTDAQKRMAKAREAKAQKALASKENITLKIEEPKPKPKAKPKTLESRIQALPIELRGMIKDYATYNLEQSDIDELKDIWETLEYQTQVMEWITNFILDGDIEVNPKMSKGLRKSYDTVLKLLYAELRKVEDILNTFGIERDNGLDNFDVEGYENLIRQLGFIYEGEEDGYRFRRDWCDETLGELYTGLQKIKEDITKIISKNKPTEINIVGSGGGASTIAPEPTPEEILELKLPPSIKNKKQKKKDEKKPKIEIIKTKLETIKDLTPLEIEEEEKKQDFKKGKLDAMWKYRSDYFDPNPVMGRQLHKGYLHRLEENQMIGEGIRRMIEGGATPDQRNIASFLRSRITADVAPYLKNYDPKIARDNNRRKDNTWFALQSLLHSLVHSVDSDVVVKKGITDYGLEDFLPAYTDYEDRENYTDPSVPEMFRAGLSNKTLPDEVLKMALEAYVKYLVNDKDKRKIFQKRDGSLGIQTGEAFPKALVSSKYFNNDMIDTKDIKRIEERENARAIIQPFEDRAYWGNNSVKNRDGLGARLGLLKSNWKKGNEEMYNKIRKKIIEILENINNDIKTWKSDVDSNFEDIDIKKNLFDIVEDNTPFYIEEGLDTIDYNIPSWNDALTTVRVFKGDDEDLPPHNIPAPAPKAKAKVPAPKAKAPAPAPAPAPAQAQAPQAPAPAKVKAPKAKAPAPKGRVVEVVEGKGMKIDFEDMNWGSLTEQMKAYNSQHKKDYDLESFAKMIVANPSNFQQRTLRRARFYINVLLPKKK